MRLRKAEANELDVIYSMGVDTWSGGLSLQAYLTSCRNSEKYAAGIWYVLVDKDQVVSSLIVYSRMFDLREGCFGLGSVATPLELRRKGYASKLVNRIKAELFSKHACKALYLYSDIDQEFYRKLGFVSIQDSDCMIYSKDQALFDGSLPAYF
ncbi:GNAT family N-acetyltransferase [Vibrio ostreicida]|uniref:GNAT family N-acetyltransferase n=1 Tax=Vibrio ostreicida TaxID=526588 RepID=A0ABT8C1K8_9VIBR|nr:GNAT family N-acetyltransferase [Vibrio ostreicida]MDN3612501.1 GNAT family N-acetyltransferase [Vibrio ostreicida]NPD09128.1 GNAT family N-acetyltransferase [Vibrio ostreicida]